MLDATLLSRIQFGFTMTAHIVYPSISIGVITFLVYIEGLYLLTKKSIYLTIAKFWTKIFALTFAMGVVSGIVMEFQFGTNWAGFAQKTGPLLGAIFTYEVLTAFFIEAGFLGIMLFGWQKVSATMHYLSTCIVAFGTTLSAFWIMSANSWMQVPSSYSVNAKGQFVTADWLGVIFSPNALARFSHMLLSCYLTATFIILAINAYYLYRGIHRDSASICFNIALCSACILGPTQLIVGHSVGKKVYQYQPIKTAAIEGIWETQAGAPALLFAWPDQKAEQNHWQLGIPKLASYANSGDWNARMQGLKSVPPQLRPQVFNVFWSFRIMVGCGIAMLTTAYLGALLAAFGQHQTHKYYLILCMLSAPLGIIALEMGWMCAEMGRQPWVVYGLLQTKDVASKVQPEQVLTSLILLCIVYGIIFGYYYFRYLFKVIQAGPSSIAATDLAFHYLSTFNPSKDE